MVDALLFLSKQHEHTLYFAKRQLGCLQIFATLNQSLRDSEIRGSNLCKLSSTDKLPVPAFDEMISQIVLVSMDTVEKTGAVEIVEGAANVVFVGHEVFLRQVVVLDATIRLDARELVPRFNDTQRTVALAG